MYQFPYICMGDSIFLEGGYRKDPGIYYDTVSQGADCDSIYVTDLTVRDTFEIYQDQIICEGDSIFLEGAWQKTAGTYVDHKLSFWLCDSTVITDLEVSSTVYGDDEANICEGDSVYIGGAYRKTAGVYNDTTSASSGCDSITEVQLLVNSQFTTEWDTAICEGEGIFVGGGWQTKSGIYQDDYITISGCDSTVITDLWVEPLPVVYLGGDTVVEEGVEFYLDATYLPDPDATYEWQDGSMQPTYLVREDGEYHVIVTTWCGFTTDTVNVRYGDFVCEVYVPNAFTPDGDGLNEEFRPHIDCELTSFELMIFDRWGKMVFNTYDFEQGWDGTIKGKPAEVGTYAWVVVYKAQLYGAVVTGDTVKGTVTITKNKPQ
jgi:gliding motility-associated-like protein